MSVTISWVPNIVTHTMFIRVANSWTRSNSFTICHRIKDDYWDNVRYQHILPDGSSTYFVKRTNFFRLSFEEFTKSALVLETGSPEFVNLLDFLDHIHTHYWVRVYYWHNTLDLFRKVSKGTEYYYVARNDLLNTTSLCTTEWDILLS